MYQLKLNPNRDAGKFAYHLRGVLQANLIGLDKKTKKYDLTPMGEAVLEFVRNVEENVLNESGRQIVRTSMFSMKDFDRNKIVQALNLEAGVPVDLAQKIAEETEERLLKLDTIYLTAPLIREFVNAILIEKGLHEYRHKLTRLGLPVYDVLKLIEKAEDESLDVEFIFKQAANSVMKEFTLLNILPRKIADAHLSGTLDMVNLESWIFKPTDFQHDLRVFFQEGIRISKTSMMSSTINKPKSLDSALSIIQTVIESTSLELDGEQSINHFNILLSPFVKGIPNDILKEKIKFFLFNINHNILKYSLNSKLSFGLDFNIPAFIEGIEENNKNYSEFFDESIRILDIIMDCMFEDDFNRPIFCPNLIFNLNSKNFSDENVESYLLRAHKLAAECGTVSFANLLPEWQKNSSYFSTGNRISNDWSGDWELDTIRTGAIGNVAINLPKVAYESQRKDSKFINSLKSIFRIAINALKIKNEAMQDRISRSLLPIFSRPVAGEPYFRVKNSILLVSYVGLNEALKFHFGKFIYEDKKALDFAIKILGNLTLEAKKLSWDSGLRIKTSQIVDDETSRHFAEIDNKKNRSFITSQERETLYYTDNVIVPLDLEIPLNERLKIEEIFHPILEGGHFFPIVIEQNQKTEDLFKITKKICKEQNIGFFAYAKSISYCIHCHKKFEGILKKCPQCKSVEPLVSYGRISNKFLPLNFWPNKMKLIQNRFKYKLN